MLKLLNLRLKSLKNPGVTLFQVVQVFLLYRLKWPSSVTITRQKIKGLPMDFYRGMINITSVTLTKSSYTPLDVYQFCTLRRTITAVVLAKEILLY